LAFVKKFILVHRTESSKGGMTQLLEAPAVIGPNCVQTDPKCGAKNQLIEGRQPRKQKKLL
jgi:hypothetical protein